MNIKSGCFLLLLASGLALSGIDCTESTEPNPVINIPHNKILFDSRHNGIMQLYMMNPDGSDIVQLTFKPKGCMDGRWSRDATMIVYEYLEGGSANSIAILTIDGKERILPGSGYWPTLSPDNRYVAVPAVTMTEYGYGIVTTVYDLQKDTVVLRLPHRASTDWSPDGTKLLVTKRIIAETVSDPVIELVSFPDAKYIKEIGPVRAAKASWSPQGNLIAFDKSSDSIWYNSEIYTMDTLGGNIRQVTAHKTPVYYDTPRWSPNGNEILFFARDSMDTGRSLMIVPKEGGTPRVILKDKTIENCDWSW